MEIFGFEIFDSQHTVLAVKPKLICCVDARLPVHPSAEHKVLIGFYYCVLRDFNPR